MGAYILTYNPWNGNIILPNNACIFHGWDCKL